MFKRYLDFTKMCGLDGLDHQTEISEKVETTKKVEETKKEEGQETDRERQQRELKPPIILCYMIYDDYIPTHQ